MSGQILDPGYRFHQLDDLNKVSRILLSRECFHKFLERAMGNPSIPVLYTTMVPCSLCTACVGKRIWPLFVKGSIMLILHKLFHGDTTKHLYGKDTLKNLVSEIVINSNCNIILFNKKAQKVFPLKVKNMFLYF